MPERGLDNEMEWVKAVEISLIAVGLAMDAFAVSVASGITIKRMKLHHAMRIAIFFGGFQALMPLLGWICGETFKGVISEVDHWVAFGLLSAIGGKMIYEARKIGNEQSIDPLNVYVLFTLAIATSIDGLVVGVTRPLMEVQIMHAIAIIGGLTFVISLAGVQIGKRYGHLFENRFEIIGGLVLIGIGVKILIQHLFFG